MADIAINREHRTISVDGRTATLPARQFALMSTLAPADRVMSAAQLREQVIGPAGQLAPDPARATRLRDSITASLDPPAASADSQLVEEARHARELAARGTPPADVDRRPRQSP